MWSFSMEPFNFQWMYCTAERKTKTVSNEGNCPIYDESFEFQVMLPEVLLLRFVVLDDDYIGDDFIGQYTIPFDCLQRGRVYIMICLQNKSTLQPLTQPRVLQNCITF